MKWVISIGLMVIGVIAGVQGGNGLPFWMIGIVSMAAWEC